MNGSYDGGRRRVGGISGEQVVVRWLSCRGCLCRVLLLLLIRPSCAIVGFVTFIIIIALVTIMVITYYSLINCYCGFLQKCLSRFDFMRVFVWRSSVFVRLSFIIHSRLRLSSDDYSFFPILNLSV